MEDRAVHLRRVRTLARLLDNQFQVPGLGWRFGLDGLIGLIPGVGDAATAAISLYFLYVARQAGLGRGVQAQILTNLLADFALGLVPVVGDAADFVFKAHARNARLLERALQQVPPR